MSAKVKLVNLGEGIPTAKEAWLDELSKSEKIGSKKQQDIDQYIFHLVELNERRTAEIAALRDHAHRLGEHALFLQQVRESAEEADRELEKEFRELANQWYEETMLLSSTSDIVSKETYYQIVGLGKKVIPFILQELKERGGHWFLALRVLSKDNPVKPEDRGNMRKMTQAWLEWGKKHNYI